MTTVVKKSKDRGEAIHNTSMLTSQMTHPGLGDGLLEHVRKKLAQVKLDHPSKSVSLATQTGPTETEVTVGRKTQVIKQVTSDKEITTIEDTVTESITVKSRKPLKAVYEEHLTKEAYLEGLKKGTLLKGTLRILDSFHSAFVTVEGYADDFYIDGMIARNRALDNDTVIIETLKDRAPASESVTVQGSSSSEDDLTADPALPTSVASSNPNAKVVAIAERWPRDSVVGILHPPGWSPNTGSPRNSKSNYCIFQPQSKRMPFHLIHKNDLGELSGSNWREQITQNEGVIFSVKRKTWSATSRYPLAKVDKRIGHLSNIEASTQAILLERMVNSREFPDEVLDCLPSDNWCITDEERAKRRSFLDQIVLTIDPETARDLDDAVSCIDNGDGTYRISVHIADVSHFVKPETALDNEARSRATTVYLVQRAIPMLPTLLCERLCSLNPSVERLAFSVEWLVDRNGRELGPRWFGKSLIKTCCRLTYTEAQNILEGKSWEEGVGKPISDGFKATDVEVSIRNLNIIAKALRKARFDNGAVSVNTSELKFRLDEQGLPQKCEVYEHKDANRLIEEFMLFANRSVAEKISNHFPHVALLRRHAPPKEKQLGEFIRFLAHLGFDFDGSTSARFNDSLQRLREKFPSDITELIENMAARSLQRAEYFCTGSTDSVSEWLHYALAFSHYTHFTSPIRRYPDIIVHRLLECAVQDCDSSLKTKQCNEIATHCNTKKENARLAQEDSNFVFLSVYLNKYSEEHKVPAMPVRVFVTRILDHSIDVHIPVFALTRRISFLDEPSLESFEVDDSEEHVQLTFKNGTSTKLSMFNDFTAYLAADFTKTFCNIKCSLHQPVTELPDNQKSVTDTTE
ncbi:ribonuclease II family protein [Schizosaccharomyces japonicus yFS275]|uniref:DIS3-like exonuclease 2 n=1 Tax=Schizosaccharomyces japonicus (strain yFS275 / FY16936) TaxID=402676 RepID=B6K5A6_SCHJY|nr:ribonuclease II family protein [Schizosaccharomyces japonicus yFS275]EEB08710.1 ribonuclease II family protein [Schizosaccharomyces japonicus yFS275]